MNDSFHARCLQLLAGVVLDSSHWGADMAFFEQAAVLSTAWANQPDLRALGAKHSLCIITSKKLTRGHLHACMSYT